MAHPLLITRELLPYSRHFVLQLTGTRSTRRQLETWFASISSCVRLLFCCLSFFLFIRRKVSAGNCKHSTACDSKLLPKRDTKLGYQFILAILGATLRWLLKMSLYMKKHQINSIKAKLQSILQVMQQENRTQHKGCGVDMQKQKTATTTTPTRC